MDALTLGRLRDRILELHEVEFEALILEALSESGYEVHSSTRTARHAEIDFVARRDADTFLVEVRRSQRMDERNLEEITSRFLRYLSTSPSVFPVRCVLVFPGDEPPQPPARSPIDLEVWALPKVGDLLERAGLLDDLLSREPRSRRRNSDPAWIQRQLESQADSLAAELLEMPAQGRGGGHGMLANESQTLRTVRAWVRLGPLEYQRTQISTHTAVLRTVLVRRARARGGESRCPGLEPMSE
jgi:Holliday junction resolvase-like predicted endonuclease